MKVALVGLGRMGMVHLRALRLLGFDEIFGFDNAPLTLTKVSKTEGIPTFSVERLGEIVEREGVEGAILATTAPGRHLLIESVLELSSIEWILSEKPFGSSLREVQELVDLSTRSPKRLGVNHQMRFMKQYQCVLEIAEQNQLGKLVSMNVSGFNIGLANNGTHYFEAFRFLAGEEVVEVSAWLDESPRLSHRGPDFRDFSGLVFARSASDKRFVLDISGESGAGLVVTYSFPEGKVIVDELAGRVSNFFRDSRDRGLESSVYGKFPLVTNYRDIGGADLVDITARTLESLINGVSFPDASVGSHAMRATIGAVLSSEAGSIPIEIQGLRYPGHEHYERKFPWS